MEACPTNLVRSRVCVVCTPLLARLMSVRRIAPELLDGARYVKLGLHAAKCELLHSDVGGSIMSHLQCRQHWPSGLSGLFA